MRSLSALMSAVCAMATLPLAAVPQTAAAQEAPPSPDVLSLGFDQAPGDAQPRYEGRFPQPELVPGPSGHAWRSDGFSSAVSVPVALHGERGFTVIFQVAIESYPSSLEKPAEQIVPASFINQADRQTGFDVWIDTFGRWGSRVSTSNGDIETRAKAVFPLYGWAEVALTYDPDTGALRQYLDGKLVGEARRGRATPFRRADKAALTLARSWQDAAMGIFSVNGLNAAFDNLKVFGRPLSDGEIAASAAAMPASSALASLAVPASRFAEDLQRPVYHAMPPANWTNEPHGLIRRDDGWHMFYQRTPNGPYKTQMHWGHLFSTDLVHWTNFPDALWPTLQKGDFGFDMKGIWSGDVVTGPDGRGVAFYTSVNHSPDFYNPGISMAVSPDGNLLRWQKLGPVIDRTGFRDFRDPYVWFEAGEWHMIVGAAMLPSGGGIAYYRCADLFRPRCWKKQPPIAPFARMDIGSDIWEMPVLERLSAGKFILQTNPIGGVISKNGDKATRSVYWIGSWDGRAFKPDFLQPKYLDLVPGHLSPTVDRDKDGNLVGIGIVDERRSDEAQLAAGWAHTFGVPRTWRLMPDGETLGQAPLAGLAALRNPRSRLALTVVWNGTRQIGYVGRSAEIVATFDQVPDKGAYGLVIAGSADGAEQTSISYDAEKSEIVLDKRRATTGKDSLGPEVLCGSYDVRAFGVPRKFHVFVDHSVVDVFINDAAAFSFRIYPQQPDSSHVSVQAQGDARATVEAWRLDRALP